MFQAAARKAIASVVFSRIVMASPGMCEFIISKNLRNCADMNTNNIIINIECY